MSEVSLEEAPPENKEQAKKIYRICAIPGTSLQHGALGPFLNC